jgi:hypothetical protein
LVFPNKDFVNVTFASAFMSAMLFRHLQRFVSYLGKVPALQSLDYFYGLGDGFTTISYIRKYLTLVKLGMSFAVALYPMEDWN